MRAGATPPSDDAIGVADIEERLDRLAKGPLSAGKEAPGTTTPRPAKTRKGKT